MLDVREFALYVKKALLEQARSYEGHLLSATYDDLSQAKRAGGIRDTLISIANFIEPALDTFKKEKMGSKSHV